MAGVLSGIPVYKNEADLQRRLGLASADELATLSAQAQDPTLKNYVAQEVQRRNPAPAATPAAVIPAAAAAPAAGLQDLGAAVAPQAMAAAPQGNAADVAAALSQLTQNAQIVNGGTSATPAGPPPAAVIPLPPYPGTEVPAAAAPATPDVPAPAAPQMPQMPQGQSVPTLPVPQALPSSESFLPDQGLPAGNPMTNLMPLQSFETDNGDSITTKVTGGKKGIGDWVRQGFSDPQALTFLIGAAAAMASPQYRTMGDRIAGAFGSGLAALGAVTAANQARLDKERKAGLEERKVQNEETQTGIQQGRLNVAQQAEARQTREGEAKTKLEKQKLDLLSTKTQGDLQLLEQQIAEISDKRSRDIAKTALQHARETVKAAAGAYGELTEEQVASMMRQQVDYATSVLQSFGTGKQPVSPQEAQLRSQVKALNPNATEAQIDAFVKKQTADAAKRAVVKSGGVVKEVPQNIDETKAIIADAKNTATTGGTPDEISGHIKDLQTIVDQGGPNSQAAAAVLGMLKAKNGKAKNGD